MIDHNNHFNNRRIQIWANKKESEFAICLSNEPKFFRAMTNENEKQYEKLVEETDYLDDMNYNWEFTLKCWVNNRFSDTYRLNGGTTESPLSSQFSNTEFVVNRGTQSTTTPRKQQQKKYKRSKSNLKCHYCGLMFSSDKERSEHEDTWHVDKKLKSTTGSL